MRELILGLDEAGKGPVIGPMILAGVLIDKKDEAHLRRMGVKDSKVVTSKRREFLEGEIKKVILSYEVIICEASEIDETNSKGIKLPEYEADGFSRIINKINVGNEKIRVVIDCPSIGILKWRDTLKRKIDNLSNVELVIEHKADRNHLAVSAASIIAKSERERKMNELKEKYGEEIGSGYCTDPLTIKFIEKFAIKFGNDGLFRRSWETWRVYSNKLKQQELSF